MGRRLEGKNPDGCPARTPERGSGDANWSESWPWRPSAVIKLSSLLHIGAALVTAVKPGTLPWAITAVAFNHLVLTAAGLYPTSRLLGPNLRRLPAAARERGAVAITLDDGPDPHVTPLVLDILDRYKVSASFFSVGERAARYSDLVGEIVRRGHAIENHTHHHPLGFPLLGPAAMRRELADAQAVLTSLSGRRPRFFRPVAGLRNPFLEPVLCQLGLRLVSWTRRGFDSLDGDACRVAARLSKRLAAGDILMAHDGGSARTRAGTPVVLEVLPRVLDAVEHLGLRGARLDALVPER